MMYGWGDGRERYLIKMIEWGGYMMYQIYI